MWLQNSKSFEAGLQLEHGFASFIITQFNFAMLWITACLETLVYLFRARRDCTFIIVTVVLCAKAISNRLESVVAVVNAATWASHIDTIYDNGAKTSC